MVVTSDASPSNWIGRVATCAAACWTSMSGDTSRTRSRVSPLRSRNAILCSRHSDAALSVSTKTRFGAGGFGGSGGGCSGVGVFRGTDASAAARRAGHSFSSYFRCARVSPGPSLCAINSCAMVHSALSKELQFVALASPEILSGWNNRSCQSFLRFSAALLRLSEAGSTSSNAIKRLPRSASLSEGCMPAWMLVASAWATSMCSMIFTCAHTGSTCVCERGKHGWFGRGRVRVLAVQFTSLADAAGGSASSAPCGDTSIGTVVLAVVSGDPPTDPPGA